MHRAKPVAIAEQRDNLVRDRPAVAKGDENAVSVIEQFGGMGIGRRNDCFSEGHRIGERSGRRLARPGVGRDIDVGCLDQVEQRIGFQKRVDPLDMAFDA